MRYDFDHVRRDTLQMNLAYDGTESITALYFTIRNRLTDEQVKQYSKTSGSFGTITIASTYTDVTPGIYKYDMQITLSGGGSTITHTPLHGLLNVIEDQTR